MSDHGSTTDAPAAGGLSTIDFNTLFRPEASLTDRGRVLADFGGVVKTRLQDAAAAAGEGTERLADRAGQLLGEMVNWLPIRRAENLRQTYGAQASERVINDATSLAQWLWVTAKAFPGPELVVHAAKVVLHSAIEIRMVGELHEAHRDPEVEAAPTPLPTTLATWAASTSGASDESPATVGTIFVRQVRRGMGELRTSGGLVKTLLNRGREGGKVVSELGHRVDAILRPPVVS